MQQTHKYNHTLQLCCSSNTKSRSAQVFADDNLKLQYWVRIKFKTRKVYKKSQCEYFGIRIHVFTSFFFEKYIFIIYIEQYPYLNSLSSQISVSIELYLAKHFCKTSETSISKWIYILDFANWSVTDPSRPWPLSLSLPLSRSLHVTWLKLNLKELFSSPLLPPCSVRHRLLCQLPASLERFPSSENLVH